MKQSPHKDQLPIVTTLLSILIGGTGVAMGAFGAHFLASRLSDKQAAIFAVAVDYHQLYSVVLFGIMDGIDYEFKFDGIDCYLSKFKIVSICHHYIFG